MRPFAYLFVLASFVFSSSGLLAQETAPPKIAFLYISAANDPTGWTRQHERGRRSASAFFGPKAQLDYFENIPDSEAALTLMRQLADDGYDLFFATSILFQDAAINLAFEFPDVKIELATGYVRTANLATYSARFYEGRVVHGIIAGGVTKTNKIGYIAPFPTPEVIRGINAAFLAARSVNEDVEFEIVWVNSYYDADIEERVARELVANGADVLMQHTFTSRPMEVAQELGIYAFGYSSEMREFGPDASLTSTIDHWGPYYIKRIRALIDGNWENTDALSGMASNTQIIGKLSDDIPNRVTLQALEAIAKIRNGELHPFSGPIQRQDGSGWLAAGEVASETDLLTMDFFVKGINGIIPDYQ